MHNVPTSSELPADLEAFPIPQPNEPTSRQPSPTVSLLTLPRTRPASPQGDLRQLQDVFLDFGLWHRGPCREVLLQFIQTCTLRDIRCMTRTQDLLHDRLNDFLVRRRAAEIARRKAEEVALIHDYTILYMLDMPKTEPLPGESLKDYMVRRKVEGVALIQAYTVQDIPDMPETRLGQDESLKEYMDRRKAQGRAWRMKEELARKRAEEEALLRAEEYAMSFLEFPPRGFQTQNRARSSSRTSVSSSSSTSSQRSRSSQVSDSDLNDVQQSAEALRLDLNDALHQLLVLEGGLAASKFGLPSKLKPLKGKPGELEEAFNAALKTLRDTYSMMGDLGFRKRHCTTTLAFFRYIAI